jgi:hypothetical protein
MYIGFGQLIVIALAIIFLFSNYPDLREKLSRFFDNQLKDKKNSKK